MRNSLTCCALLALCAASPGFAQQLEDAPAQFTAILHSRQAPLVRATGHWRLAPAFSLHGEVEASRRTTFGEAYLNTTLGNWSLNIGRQRVALGDERLLGANRDVPGLAPGWDGGRLSFARGRFTAEALALRSTTYETSLGGLVIGFAPVETMSIESYYLRKSDRVAVTGVRAAGIAENLAYNIEIACEGARGWAGHWEIVPSDYTGGAGIEFNYASTQFDEFFPAALNQHGLEDPYPWQDLRNAAFHYERKLTRNITGRASYRTYWNAHGRYLGQDLVGSIVWEREQWTLGAGIGRKPSVIFAYRF